MQVNQGRESKFKLALTKNKNRKQQQQNKTYNETGTDCRIPKRLKLDLPCDTDLQPLGRYPKD